MSDALRVKLYGAAAFENNAAPHPDVEKIKGTRFFHRAVVIETVCDVSLRSEPPSTLSDADKQDFLRAPRNSLVCRVLTDENNMSTNNDILCFPFFSSHFILPVKAGEQVWVMRETLFVSTGRNRSYWISRVADELAIEDVNYTPFSREIQNSHTGSLPPERLQEVPNSRSSANSKIIFGDDNAIKDLSLKSLESPQVVYEPIPRLTKRPGDLVLQGSNNAAVVLGIDRGFTTVNRPAEVTSSNSSDAVSEKSGTIDIVAGRGRYFDSNENESKLPRKKAQSKGTKNSTQPFVSKNGLDKFEVDKDPAMAQDLNGEVPDPGNAKTNPAEGDPDFLVDASRVYVAENSAIDLNFGLDNIIPTTFENAYNPQVGPAVGIKSDHIRIVARQVPNSFVSGKLPPKFDEVGSNGTIRIIKEGDKDKDLASIIIEADGTVHISGSKIFIGRSTGDGGAGTGPGPGESQPYVMYKQLEKVWQDTMEAINSFCDTLKTHTTPGYGSPSAQINMAADELKQKVSQLKSDIESVQSKRIFGE